MTSRRLPSFKLVEDAPLPLKLSKAPPTKHHSVGCLVFFSHLFNTSTKITSHIWRQITTGGTNKRHLLRGVFTISLSLFLLISIPLFILQEIPSQHLLFKLYIVWTALLHIAAWPVAVLCSALAAWHAYKNHSSGNNTTTTNKALYKSGVYVIVGLAVLIIVTCQIQIIAPSWLWNPFLWGRYPIYLPSDLNKALEGMCLDNTNAKRPLCLSEKSWKTLSAGALSSKNKMDVTNVQQGLQYAQQTSGGLVINIMSRDTVDAIPPLRENVEALLPFFKNIAVVVFENDSKDGTREAFYKWASIAQGYKVDVMSCGEDNPDCRFHISHRYDATEAKDYFQSSAIGNMADYRQRMSDYILENYSTYSHMIVVDLDLKVSLSPLGILHTLGTVPDKAVASSGRQVWPGSMGTLVPPYDFSAFRPIETAENKHLLQIHTWFCELLPNGDRWRNQCDATSSIHLLFVLMHDWLLRNKPYAVASAFNGATMYPLSLVKESNAKYDVGEDGQRCEHIGYNLAMPFVVNPKWNFHVMPTNPGGPTGVRSLKNVFRIVFMPRLSMVIFFQLMIFLVTFVVCCMTIAYQVSEFCGGICKTLRNDGIKLKEMELPLHYTNIPLDTLREEEDDDECESPLLGRRHHLGAAKRTSPKTTPTKC